MVASVFRKLLCLGHGVGLVASACADSASSAGVVFGLTQLFEFIAYLTKLNSNPSGSSDPWVAERPSGVPGGGPGGRVVTVVASYPAGSGCELQQSVATVAECGCFERGCCFARAAIGFVVDLHVRVGCVLLVLCLALRACAPLGTVLCSVGIFARAKRMLVCRVAPLVRFPQNCVVLVSGCCGIALWVRCIAWLLCSGGLTGFWLHCAADGHDLDAKALLASTPWTPTTVGGHPLDANPILAARP
ncbi:hypothetical protein Taro_028648 [Colocasia esculenta]|uniref:Uncharacterized protein n=1 Tax=Colocasia esculenta TaxID=4460 RepID=A0A843VUU1_COLES|nr:hypothetical protein [Colocasia esculenta]